MDSTLVIKVKFGGTLRRFNAGIDEEGQLDLDMDGLRAKILSLFCFPPDTDLTLTYVDEDGDVVTLVDDDDLRDVMKQRLKFLRLDVQLNNDKFSKLNSRSSGNSTPPRSPQVQNPLPCITNGFSEVMRSLPDPLRDVLSKSLALASKAASESSSPVLTDFVECISKLGQSSLNTSQQAQDGGCSSSQNGASQVLKEPSVPGVPNASTMPSPATKGGRSKDLTKHVTDTVDLNLDPPSDSKPSGSITVNDAPAVSCPSSCQERVDRKKQSSDNLGRRPTGFGSSAGFSASAGFGPFGASAGFGASTGFDVSSSFGASPHFCAPTVPGFRGRSQGLNECPFTGIPVSDEGLHPSRPHRPHKKSNIHNDAMVGMFHKGVQCDGCGVHPIAGPRYKSKVKEDYDLCGICFAEMGNEDDYIKLDRPISYRHPQILKSLHDIKHWARAAPPPGVYSNYGMRPAPGHKLDSSFVLDVNVVDGTTMAPSTPFTKIWRMRNTGNVPWPKGVRLMWTGGQRFSHADSTEIEIPAEGVPVGGELDLAMDFTAPELPGSYRSVWRMVSPSGVRFGQHVWVQIEVNACLSDSVCDSLKGLNLNLPAYDDNSKSGINSDVNVHPVANGSNSDAIPVKLMVDEQPKTDPELNFPMNDTTSLVSLGAPATVEQPQGSSSISYPIVDFSEAPILGYSGSAPAAPPQTLPRLDIPSSSEDSSMNNSVEKTLLKELEDMGFKQVDLNKEVLRMNEYNLEQSVDELCGVAEWDPILEELEEMGFCDKEMNKKLLKKNNGSIKRVVMDILDGARGQ